MPQAGGSIGWWINRDRTEDAQEMIDDSLVIKAELERPDAILDLAMPDLDGFTVCEVLKSNLFTRTIPVIFMTATTKEKNLMHFKNTMAQGIILKPFDTLNLRSLIATICNW